ncbi:hypothetical protein JJQ72_11675 [Paenibacillus sp. F411]|nr:MULTISPECIES: hypothetical protein [Paenibacillus]MBO2944629.1 hypothetical protein [Paenibacillus sp. F411]
MTATENTEPAQEPTVNLQAILIIRRTKLQDRSSDGARPLIGRCIIC